MLLTTQLESLLSVFLTVLTQFLMKMLSYLHGGHLSVPALLMALQQSPCKYKIHR